MSLLPDTNASALQTVFKSYFQRTYATNTMLTFLGIGIGAYVVPESPSGVAVVKCILQGGGGGGAGGLFLQYFATIYSRRWWRRFGKLNRIYYRYEFWVNDRVRMR